MFRISGKKDQYILVKRFIFQRDVNVHMGQSQLFLYWTQVCGQILIYSFLHGKTNMSLTRLIEAF